MSRILDRFERTLERLRLTLMGICYICERPMPCNSTACGYQRDLERQRAAQR